VLVSEAAPAEVESDDERSDTEKEDTDCLWVALPVDDWIHLVVHIEETEVVSKHVEESMPGHEFPVGSKELDVSEVNVNPGHDQWTRMENGHMCDHEICFSIPCGWSIHILNLNDDHWSQNAPEAEGDCQVQAVREFKPSERHNVIVLGVFRS